MPDATTISELIAQLAGSDIRAREKAAGELFRRGCAQAEPVLRNWFADAEFRKLIRSGPGLLTVGVAVEPARFEQMHRTLGAPRLADVPPDQDAREFELEFGHGVRLDILTTRDVAGGGAIARFVARFGEGIQQVECEVRDVTRATQILRERFSVEPLYPETRPGANGTRVNFFLVSAPDGRKVLLELVEAIPQKQSK
jgi:hypothetical protein